MDLSRRIHLKNYEPIIKAITTIENNLTENIELKKIAHEAGYSLYHFHRVFKSIVKDNLKDYIRKRRITEAAKSLIFTQDSIIDIALKYQYETRESFSRSFKQTYGTNPSDVRKKNEYYGLREKLRHDELLARCKELEMGLNPKIIHLPKLYFKGQKITVKADGSNLKDIPLFWTRWRKENSHPNPVGICLFSDNITFDYMIAYEIDITSLIDDCIVVEESDYALFRVEGQVIEQVQKTWDSIYSTWLNQSGYKHRGNLDIEKYYYNQDKPYVELLVPIIKI